MIYFTVYRTKNHCKLGLKLGSGSENEGIKTTFKINGTYKLYIRTTGFFIVCSSVVYIQYVVESCRTQFCISKLN